MSLKPFLAVMMIFRICDGHSSQILHSQQPDTAPSHRHLRKGARKGTEMLSAKKHEVVSDCTVEPFLPVSRYY
jgi:hypothetical protein